ncbi:hypothetical protein, partial [Ruminococcus callidus]|uniref:hypothetical protein n=2 Tax=Ruminococcus callidus TaxID=40519 RepID=UPI0023F8C08A
MFLPVGEAVRRQASAAAQWENSGTAPASKMLLSKKRTVSAIVALPLSVFIVSLWQYRTKIVRQMRRQIFRQMKQKA